MAGKALKIRDFANMGKFEGMIRDWAKATGFAVVALDSEGKYISEYYNRSSSSYQDKIGGQDIPGDFSIDLMLDDMKLGKIAGGKSDAVHSVKMNDEYSDMDSADNEGENKALEESVQSAGTLLGDALNNFLYAEYTRARNAKLTERLSMGISETNALVKEIQKSTNELMDIQRRQKILAINANIEAARAGENGKGFSVVADEVGRLSESSSAVNDKIADIVKKIADVVSTLSIDD